MTKVQISDHALVRWLERVEGLDMEAWRAKLAEIAQPYADLKVKHAFVGGVWLVFQDNALVTVTPTKPVRDSYVKHDRHSVNGTATWAGDPRHWKHKKRRGGK